MEVFLCPLFAEVLIRKWPFPSKFNEMENILKTLKNLQLIVEKQNLLAKDYLDIKETSKYLRLSESALYKMTSRNEIPFYKPGGKKIYFKRSELNEWIEFGKKGSNVELADNLETYLSRNIKSIKS